MQSLSRDRNIDVLIVGAGPSGLMMACQLAIQNISFLIIDKKDHSTNYSGALIVQARSLEIFQQMDIAQAAVDSGVVVKEIKLIFNGQKSFTIPVKNIGEGLSQFPYLLLLEQSKTEQLLINFIHNYGYSVERETELVQFSQDNYGVTSILQLPNGEKETITSKYLIAADGARSTIRKQLQIPFIGTTYPTVLFVCDCKAEGNLSSNQLCFSFSNGTTAGFFSLADGRWRVDGTISKEMGNRDQLTFDDIGKVFTDRTRMNVNISDPDWFSVFRVNERYALSFQTNRCFLVGDAAHIHSPVGAQGMNTGLQDSYNLAWKLALVIRGKAKTTLPETYSSERIAVAKNVIQGTSHAFTFVTSKNIFAKIFRIRVLPYILHLTLPLLIKQQFIRHFFFRRISETGIQYRKSALSKNSSLGNFPAYAPKPGDRLPYIPYNENGQTFNIQHKVKGTDFHLFIFSKHVETNIIRQISEKYNRFISVETIPYTSGTISLYDQLGILDSGYYLVRPDLYIAYRSSKPEADLGHFENYLRQFVSSFQ